MIVAFFQSSGTTPTESNWLKTKARGLLRVNLSYLNKKGGSPSGPELSLFFSLSIADITSSSLISMLSRHSGMDKLSQCGATLLSTTPIDEK